jgi:hypothetical protein
MQEKLTASQASAKRVREFKKRMYDQGYKQKVIWVKRDDSKTIGLIDRKLFMSKLDELSADFTKIKLNRLYHAVLSFVKGGNW